MTETDRGRGLEGFDPFASVDRPEVPASLTWARLRAFLTVFESGSVTAAADLLLVTAPAVSAAIATLENELGTKLFTRSGRGIVPTESGTVFASYSRRLLGLVGEARAAVQEADRARLRIGTVATAAETLLPRLLGSFTRAEPSVDVLVRVEPRDELFSGLGHHEVDVVLAGRPPAGSDFVSRATRTNALVLVGAPGTRAATWLLRGHGSGTRETALALLTGLDSPPRTLTLGTQGACVAAAREGLGVTLVHEDAVRRDLDAGELVEVQAAGTPLKRPWHLCTGPHPNRAVELFLDHVTDPERVGDDVLRPA